MLRDDDGTQKRRWRTRAQGPFERAGRELDTIVATVRRRTRRVRSLLWIWTPVPGGGKVMLVWPFTPTVFVVRLAPGVAIESHIDESVDGWQHWRASIVVRASGTGGDLYGDRVVWLLQRRLALFRADRTHGVTVASSERIALSIGGILPDALFCCQTSGWIASSYQRVRTNIMR